MASPKSISSLPQRTQAIEATEAWPKKQTHAIAKISPIDVEAPSV
ncbi:hypothetical protein N9D23_08050 [Rubripirellula sp.]|nr:hypothetical protein [Rubripirellula sp.]